jgi:ketosteroid isomerase-like protein
MGSAENQDVVRRGYAAFSSGDADTLRELMAPDVVQNVPGSSPMAGAHKGIDSVLALYGELAERSNGTIRVELEDVLSNGADQVVAIHMATAERNGETLAMREALLFTIRDGRVAEMQEFVSDIAANDAFWG